MRTSGYHVTSPDWDGEVIHDCDVSRCRCRIPCHHDARQPFTSDGAERYAAAMRRGNAGLTVTVEPCECFARPTAAGATLTAALEEARSALRDWQDAADDLNDAEHVYAEAVKRSNRADDALERAQRAYDEACATNARSQGASVGSNAESG